MQSAYPEGSAEPERVAENDAWRRRLFIVMTIVGVSLLSACITAPPKKPSSVEQARQENAVGTELSRQFEAKLHFKTDPVVDRYLNDLAKMVSSVSGDTRLINTGVAIIQDRGGQWRTYSLPGRRIYFSVGLLQQLKYDNEVAAVIALEFGNILERHALDHLAKLTQAPTKGTGIDPHVEFFGENGIFGFDVGEIKTSIKAAVGLLYNAGFDIRGLSQIWEIFGANSSHSPFSDGVLDELNDYTRDIISKYAPLRNPIVGTKGFQTIRKRIQAL
jgi:hypothetical protein